MCRTTNEGYIMKDGTLVPFKKLEIGDINPEHIDELNKSTASVLDLVLLNNKLFDWKDEIKNDVTKQIEKFAKTIIEHSKYCPANEERVKEIISTELVSENVKELMQKELMTAALEKLDKGSKIVRYVWRAVVALFILFNIYMIFKGKAPIQITP